MEQVQSLFPVAEAYVPQARVNAQYYNCSGLHFPGHIAPFGYSGSLGPAPFGDMRQHTDASFLALHHVWTWEYGHNTTFARQHALPFLTGVADWWRCWLQVDSTSAIARASPDGFRFVDAHDCNNENCGNEMKKRGSRKRK